VNQKLKASVGLTLSARTRQLTSEALKGEAKGVFFMPFLESGNLCLFTLFKAVKFRGYGVWLLLFLLNSLCFNILKGGIR